MLRHDRSNCFVFFAMSKLLLVIDYDNSNNWFHVFKGARLDSGEEIRVDQTAWDLISLAVDSCCADDDVDGNGGLVVEISPSISPIFGSPQKYNRTIRPDFLLVRNVTRGAHGRDFRNLLLGFKLAGIGSVNSLRSILACQERADMYGELLEIRRRVGRETFPLHDLTYFPNIDESLLIQPPVSPAVVKVGSAHAGYGKIRTVTETDFRDVRTTLAMHREYYTVEAFLDDVVEDIRVQKIGENIRCYRRIGDNWKANMGMTTYEDIRATDFLRQVVELGSEIYGGLDICSVDLLRCGDGSYVILEVNDTATGLNESHAEEDEQIIRDLVISKMNLRFGWESFDDDDGSTILNKARLEQIRDLLEPAHPF